MLVALQLLIQAGYHQFQVGKLLLILDHDGWSDRHQLLWLLYSKERKRWVSYQSGVCIDVFLMVKFSYLWVMVL